MTGLKAGDVYKLRYVFGEELVREELQDQDEFIRVGII